MVNQPAEFSKQSLLVFAISLTVLTLVFTIPQIQNLFGVDTAKDVFVMYAGSLVKIMENNIAPSFHNQTGNNFVGEGKGSMQVANLILDGFRRPDVFVSADTLPIIKIMNHDSPLANWLVKFASAELVIAYNPNSKFAPDLAKAAKGELPWYKVLEEKGFKFRRTDPELDPKGYYTIMAAKLANIYYNDSTIKDRILGSDRNPDQVYPEEVLRSILESGQIDAIVAYKHEAVARGLPYITLPRQINLGDPNYNNFYNQTSYLFHSNQTIPGGTVFFSFTIPTTVRNMDGAISFSNFLISPQGKLALSQVGLNPIKPLAQGDIMLMPSRIKKAIQ
jgi:molybdate/tungstate transport system substrate-binding protein